MISGSSAGDTGAVPRALWRLRRACAPICAEGTDPTPVAAVLAWSVGPRRSPDALRRRCRDRGSRDGGHVEGLQAAAGTPSRGDAEAALALVGVWRRLGVRLALVGDEGYPRRLAEGWPTTDGPPLLALQGEGATDLPSVAVVGARRATGYGVSSAAWLADAAAAAGVRVVSGGAVGIDAAAHDAALERPGGTTVVLGCGHAVPYPRGHARPGGLFDRILDEGGAVVSEALPYERPRPGLIRARNRIVAALAEVVVVVEGGPRSGALLTASAAADRGRTVLAVPGDVRAPGSVAPHRLLSEGAVVCTGPETLLDALHARGALDVREPRPSAPQLPDLPDAGTPSASMLPPAVLDALRVAWPRPLRPDDLASLTSTSVPVLLAALSRARAAGEIAQGVDGVRLRRAPDYLT